jgi:hypothetical protein
MIAAKRIEFRLTLDFSLIIRPSQTQFSHREANEKRRDES